jgi:hypothetical protein
MELSHGAHGPRSHIAAYASRSPPPIRNILGANSKGFVRHCRRGLGAPFKLYWDMLITGAYCVEGVPISGVKVELVEVP